MGAGAFSRRARDIGLFPEELHSVSGRIPGRPCYMLLLGSAREENYCL